MNKRIYLQDLYEFLKDRVSENCLDSEVEINDFTYYEKKGCFPYIKFEIVFTEIRS